MNVKIELPNPKYCDGCPVLYVDQEDGEETCSKGYNNGKPMEREYIPKCGYFNIRPEECIKENGL